MAIAAKAKKHDVILPAPSRTDLVVVRATLMNAGRVVISVFVAVLATFAMLLMNWFAVPWLNHALLPRGTPLGLLTDLALTFFVAFSFMVATLQIKYPHGLIIAVFMALCGWGIYFAEVGYLPGILNSEFPFWYELFSFTKYPLALGLALFAASRGNPSDSDQDTARDPKDKV